MKGDLIMKVHVKTVDGDIHAFSDTDAIEALQLYRLDKEAHIFWVKTIGAELIFSLENVIWVKMVEKEM